MPTWNRWLIVSWLGLAGCVLALWMNDAVEASAQAAENSVVVTDFSGKEHKLKAWKFVAGTRHLTWLAPPEKTEDGKGKKEPTTSKTRPAIGPEALELSEGKAAPLKKRVLSFVLLEHIRAIEFDHKKELITVRIAKNDKEADDEVLQGLTGYIGMNQLAIEAEVDLGELGIAAVKFQGGVARGVRGIRFPAPKPAPGALTGRPAVVTASDRAKSVHAVVDLQPLYSQQNGTSSVLPPLYFQKTVKIDVAKIAKLSHVGGNNGAGLVFDVTLKDGNQNPLVLIERPNAPEGKPVILEGLVGRVASGYKLFPMSVIGEATFDEQKRP